MPGHEQESRNFAVRTLEKGTKVSQVIDLGTILVGFGIASGNVVFIGIAGYLAGEYVKDEIRSREQKVS